MKRIVTVTHVDAEQYEPDWPEPSAIAALDWFKSKIESIPEEFRGSARMDIDGTSSYDLTLARIRITYQRPETDEEESNRLGEEAQRALRKQQDEIALLQRLQAKYATNPKD